MSASGLPIRDLAALAGVSPRAIRHYHAVGLLPEPSRDGSGYRRYGPVDVVAAVRVTRLRALGMPIPQIIEAHTATDDRDLPTALLTLAADLDQEIARLTELRDRLHTLAGSDVADPVVVLAEALDVAALPSVERDAADLVDALHPAGMQGALAQAAPLLGDQAARTRLGGLIARFRVLAESGQDPEVLAGEFADALPRPEGAADPVDPDVMESMLGDRLDPAQLRCLRAFRRIVDARDGQ